MVPKRVEELVSGTATINGHAVDLATRAKYAKAFGDDAWNVSMPSRGLGDVIAKVTSKLGVKPCKSCKKRQKWANRIVPFHNRQPFTYVPGVRPEFVTTAKLMEDAKLLASMLPPDTSMVIGVARSGLTVASLVAMILHRPIEIVRQSHHDLIDGGNGWRLTGNTTASGPVVVIDDTCMTGNSLKHVMPLVRKVHKNAISATVYCNPHARQKPDIWVRDLPWPHLLEWNLFNSILSPNMAVDFDGILCHDPQTSADDDDGPRYERFLRDTKPLYLARKV